MLIKELTVLIAPNPAATSDRKLSSRVLTYNTEEDTFTVSGGPLFNRDVKFLSELFDLVRKYNNRQGGGWTQP